MSFLTSKPRIFHVFYSLNISTLFVIFCASVFVSDRSFPVFLWEEWFWWIVDMKHMLVEPQPRSGDDIQRSGSIHQHQTRISRLLFLQKYIRYCFHFVWPNFCDFLSINLFRFSAFKAKAVLLSLQHAPLNISDLITIYVQTNAGCCAVPNISLSLCHDFRRFLAHIRAFWL